MSKAKFQFFYIFVQNRFNISSSAFIQSSKRYF